MKLLLIENNVKVAVFLKKGLTENGYTVDVEADGHEGLVLAQTNNYDIIILDVMLSTTDSWEILKKLRMNDSKSYIIMLTGRSHIDSIIKGLNLGADDYLVKPFSFSELLARIRAVLRRQHSVLKRLFVCHDLKVDFNKNKVSRSSVKIDLTPKEFMLFTLLIKNENSAISRSEISEKIWGINFDTETNLVDVHIRRLRAKIDDNFDKKFIKTVRSIGYMFDSEID
jgi:two-component system, OmpR family, copper resistance phosphate regulon response regulator CusR